MIQSAMLALCLTVSPGAVQAPPAQPKAGAKVEFRWLEPHPVKGLTEATGLRTTCGEELSYPHKVPVLTNTDVLAAGFETHAAVMGVPGDHYLVTFDLTDKARKKLVAASGEPVKELAVFVDGKYWGAAPFRKAKAAAFLPQAGYFRSKPDAERIAATFR
jgi:hypothetical protein